MTAIAPPHTPSPTVLAGVVIPGASWDDYEAMLRIIGERRIFVNYDSGLMEVLVPSYPHEEVRDALRLMVDILCEEREVPMKAGGTTTHKREDLGKGVEPDECYWLGDKAAAMVGRKELDLNRDPCPSLVIEVNYTSSSIDRLGIYAALGVEEVWRYHKGLEFLTLEGGSYRPVDPSRNLPMLWLGEATRFLILFPSMERGAWMKAFRAWVRDQPGPCPMERPAAGPP